MTSHAQRGHLARALPAYACIDRSGRYTHAVMLHDDAPGVRRRSVSSLAHGTAVQVESVQAQLAGHVDEVVNDEHTQEPPPQTQHMVTAVKSSSSLLASLHAAPPACKFEQVADCRLRLSANRRPPQPLLRRRVERMSTQLAY